MPKINKIAFIGMGLINSSLARALKKNKWAHTLVATSRSKKTRERVKELDIVDEVKNDYASTVNNANLVIIGIPVASYKEVLIEIKPYLSEDVIITDVGSVKKSIINEVNSVISNNINFIPGHPIAGTEHSGPDSGFAELFKGGWCILTPDEKVSQRSLNIVREMWEKVGMKVDIMSPNHHDIVLAITSHIPHIIAYSIVGTVSNLEEKLKKEVTKYAASGFRDFTRIAASDPIMWRDILLLNKDAILEMLNQFKSDLGLLEKAIKNNEGDFLEELFSKTRAIRKDIVIKKNSSI